MKFVKIAFQKNGNDYLAKKETNNIALSLLYYNYYYIIIILYIIIFFSIKRDCATPIVRETTRYRD